jgi:hypothetical protein
MHNAPVGVSFEHMSRYIAQWLSEMLGETASGMTLANSRKPVRSEEATWRMILWISLFWVTSYSALPRDQLRIEVSSVQ